MWIQYIWVPLVIYMSLLLFGTSDHANYQCIWCTQCLWIKSTGVSHPRMCQPVTIQSSIRWTLHTIYKTMERQRVPLCCVTHWHCVTLFRTQNSLLPPIMFWCVWVTKRPSSVFLSHPLLLLLNIRAVDYTLYILFQNVFAHWLTCNIGLVI